jgi:SAM-dependent methyltransferase
MTTATTTPAPNHHADHPGMHGFAGVLAGLTMALGNRRRSQLALDLAAPQPDDDLVDVGCGPGRATGAAGRRAATFVGLDPTPMTLRMARAWPGRGRGRVTWRTGTAEALPIADDAASVVWAVATVHHWRDVDAGSRRGEAGPAARWATGRDRALAPAVGGERAGQRRLDGRPDGRLRRRPPGCRTTGRRTRHPPLAARHLGQRRRALIRGPGHGTVVDARPRLRTLGHQPQAPDQRTP